KEVAAAAAFLLALRFLSESRHLLFELSLELFRPLVPGDRCHHFFNSRDLLLHTSGLFEASFRLYVLRSQVGGHEDKDSKNPVPGTSSPSDFEFLISNGSPNVDSSNTSNLKIIKILKLDECTNPHSGNHSKSEIRNWTEGGGLARVWLFEPNTANW